MRRHILNTLVAVLVALSCLRAAAQKSGYNPKPGSDSTGSPQFVDKGM